MKLLFPDPRFPYTPTSSGAEAEMVRRFQYLGP